MLQLIPTFRRAATIVALVAPGYAGTAHAQAGDTGAPAGLLECPIQQKPVKNGARPDAALFRNILRCKHGEKPVAPGDEGAMQVEVTGLQIGTPRRWSYQQDLGSGQIGTIVYPVRTSFSTRRFWRTATEVSEGWIRVSNYYVDAFGEWQIGSETPVRNGTFRRIPR